MQDTYVGPRSEAKYVLEFVLQKPNHNLRLPTLKGINSRKYSHSNGRIGLVRRL